VKAAAEATVRQNDGQLLRHARFEVKSHAAANMVVSVMAAWWRGQSSGLASVKLLHVVLMMALCCWPLVVLYLWTCTWRALCAGISLQLKTNMELSDERQNW